MDKILDIYFTNRKNYLIARKQFSAHSAPWDIFYLKMQESIRQPSCVSSLDIKSAKPSQVFLRVLVRCRVVQTYWNYMYSNYIFSGEPLTIKTATIIFEANHYISNHLLSIQQLYGSSFIFTTQEQTLLIICFVIFFGVEGCVVDHPRITIIKEEEE